VAIRVSEIQVADSIDDTPSWVTNYLNTK